MSLTDTQSERDSRGWRINRVGITDLLYPVLIDGVSTPARFTITADLAQELRGTHMSRFVAVLHKYREDFSLATMLAMGRELRSSLKSTEAHIEAVFPFFMEKKAPVSGQSGFVSYQGKWDISLRERATDALTTIVVPIGTLCPCSKAISDRGAHNQRGHVTLTVRAATPPTLLALIALVESAASSELYSVLKRTDEKFVTERAYDHPTFVEDVARNVAVRVSNLPGAKWFRVKVQNFESIHNHDAYAEIESEVSGRRNRK